MEIKFGKIAISISLLFVGGLGMTMPINGQTGFARLSNLIASKEVKQVKGTAFQSCPNRTLAQLSEYMESPYWRSWNDNHGNVIVSMNGGITVQEKPVRASIEFEVKGDEISYHALAMNDVPSPFANLLVFALLEKMCESTGGNVVRKTISTDDFPNLSDIGVHASTVSEQPSLEELPPAPSEISSIGDEESSDSAKAENDDNDKTINTIGGELSISGNMNAMILQMNGKELSVDNGSFVMSFEKKFKINETDVILIGDATSATCQQYFFLSIESQEAVKTSPSFGTCDDGPVIIQKGPAINLTMRDKTGKKVRYIFENGVIFEDSVLLKK